MSLRDNVVKCIQAAPSPDEAARVVIAMLDWVGLDLEGNGWLDDDPEMQEDMGRCSDAWQELADK
jgi:hypothetical protein